MNLKNIRDYLLIRRSGLFDKRYYLRKYADIRQADIDPLAHYVKFGWKEGRNPSEGFNSAYYLATNPDVQQSKFNPLVHYMRYGISEGRRPCQLYDDSELPETLSKNYQARSRDYRTFPENQVQTSTDSTLENLNLHRKLASKDLELKALKFQLTEITSSKAYKVALMLRKIRLTISATKKFWEKIPYWIQRAFLIYRNWGLRELITRSQRKLRKRTEILDAEPVIRAEGSHFSDVYSEICKRVGRNQSPDYIPLPDKPGEDFEKKIKLIAFYLPQYHPIVENDLWWGKGFTEWTNVAKALPQFEGHYQPHLPGELGFYDLRIPEIQQRQVELARQYGLYGFCFYYYWFNGKRLLELPLDQYINNPEIDFPFCVCWANENWTRRWDGRSNEILIEQTHSLDMDGAIIHDLIPLFKHKNYIHIDGRPLFILYRADLLEDPIGTLNYWRKATLDAGLHDPFIVAAQTFNFIDPRLYGFDAAVSFPPHNIVDIPEITNRLNLLNRDYNGKVFNYPDLVKHLTRKKNVAPYRLFRTVFPSWDNEARQPGKGFTFAFSTPEEYKRWLFQMCKFTMEDLPEQERFVFINAWNEWAEGAHLEPDRRFGYAYLQATHDVLKALAANEKNLGDYEVRQGTNTIEVDGTSVFYKKKYLELDRSGGFIKKAINHGHNDSADLNGSRQFFRDFTSLDMQNPVASVIIPVYNHFDDTVNCLTSIYMAGDKTPLEIIIADDGSHDETATVFSKFADLRYIRNPENLGFVKSCNHAASFAKGTYLVLLNNDTLVLPGWLDTLIETFTQFPTAGLVGSKLLFADGSLQEAGGIIWQDASAINYGRGNDPYQPKYNFLREADYCSGASICVPKEVWGNMQGFDPLFAPAYYEDADLAFRIRQKGFQVLYQPFSQVIHIEGATSGTDISKGVKHYQAVNREKFYERWKTTLKNHCDSTYPEFIFRNHMRRKHALVIDVCTPKPDQDAGSISTYQYLLMLRKIGFEVTFISDVDAEVVDGYVRDLQRRGIECIYKPYLTSIEEYIKEMGKYFALVVLVRAPHGGRYIDIVREYARQAKVVFDTVDLHFVREQRESKLIGKRMKNDGEALMNHEIGIMKKSDATIVVSDYEQELLNAIGDGLNSRVIPLTSEIPGRSQDFVGRQNIVFIGGFLHKPNQDAVLYFVNEIWPLITDALPDCEFWIIGSRMPPEIEALKGEKIKPIGFVSDLSEVFSTCKLSIAPLRFGAGVKGKVITSLSYGVPCVVTSIASEGTGLMNDHNILVGDTPQEFADAVIKLYSDSETWLRISDHGLTFLNEKFSLEVFEKNLRALISDLGITPL